MYHTSKMLEEKMRIEQDRMALFVVTRVKIKNTQNPIETIEFIEFRKMKQQKSGE